MRARRTHSGPSLRTLLFSATAIFGMAMTAHADTKVKVVTSIKPVHSLVASVMAGVGEPSVIVEGAGSPHGYALKPSQATALQNADLVFWVGHELESFLEGPIKTIGEKARIVELMDTHDLVKLKLREGGAFEAHAHDHDDDHDDHDDHAKHDDHGEHEIDLHVWLDPLNAKAMVHEIEEALVAADPGNAAKYKANAEATEARLSALVADMKKTVAPAKDRGFIVFHDAYQYFEKRFDLPASGTITVNPEVAPGAARIAEIKKKVRKLRATCVFSEPQFEPKLVKVCLLYTSPSPRDRQKSRMPSSA